MLMPIMIMYISMLNVNVTDSDLEITIVFH
jgi:hypothetical protein